jgi:protein-S-isoprenylcysteine O-methyltransferase Ste14
MLVLLIAEGYTLALVITARRATVRDFTPLSVAATMYAAFFFLLFRTDTVRIIPELVAVGVQSVALAWEVASKVTLGRSFGLLPAHRTLVLGGPYRLVRHPIYFGYLIHNVAFILANWHWQNALVITVLTLVQVYRIQREELVLSTSPEYRDYQARVRWRLVPFVW